MNTVTTEETRRSSESPPTSFSSLPYDVALNVLARISRIHRPALSLVSKSFRSLLASRELEATQTLIGKTENYIYLCLIFPQKNPKPRWFILAPTDKQQKLIPIPSFPSEHPESPTVVTIDSEIYIIAGFVYKNRSRRVFLLDCRSHQWRRLPEMRVPRGKSSAALIDGKIYVLGGCSVGQNWGEIYDPKTQTWEPLSPTTLAPNLRIQKSLESSMDRLVYSTNFCFVVEKKILWKSLGSNVKCLNWCDFEENTEYWREVKGLEGLPVSYRIISVANPGGGRRFKVWWISCPKEDGVRVLKIDFWCAEILFERRSREELYGIVEWSKILYTLDRNKNGGMLSLLCSAIVTH